MRKWFSIISVLLLIVTVIVICGIWQFTRLLRDMNIEQTNYRLQVFNLHAIHVSELSFVHKTETAQQIVHLQNVRIDWQMKLWFSPQINAVAIDHAQIEYSQSTTQE